MTCDPLERYATRNTARHWRIAVKTEVNKLELGKQLGRPWENLLLEYFEDSMRALSSALPLMANPLSERQDS